MILNINGHKSSTAHRVFSFYKNKMGVIWVAIKAMCTPHYEYNGFVTTHVLRHMI